MMHGGPGPHGWHLSVVTMLRLSAPPDQAPANSPEASGGGLRSQGNSCLTHDMKKHPRDSMLTGPPLLWAAMGLLGLGCALGQPRVQAADDPFEGLVYFRATFDDTMEATSATGKMAPESVTPPAFAEFAQATGLKAGEAPVTYDLGADFPAEAGAIEVRFKPDFPQQSTEAARTVLVLDDGGSSSLSFGFQPQGTRWQFSIQVPGWKRPIAASYYKREHEERWNHLLMVWNQREEGGPKVRFYRDGRRDDGRTERYEKAFQGLRYLRIGGGNPATTLDEVVIYRRALQDAEVEVLAKHQGSDRFVALARASEAGAQRAAQLKAARKELIAKLDGKVAQIINPKGGVPRDFKLPGGIVARGLRVEDVGSVDLGQYLVIYGPPGAGYQLTPQQNQLVLDYVQKGGGYVGVCAGANYAGKAKLLNMTTHSLKNQGLVTVGIKPHPITEGYREDVVIHHGNGPIMIPGEGCQMVGAFSIGQNFPIPTAAIVAGKNGQGRVVAFGPHPTGGEVKFESEGSKFSGAQLRTEDLLVNALLWAAGVIGKTDVQK